MSSRSMFDNSETDLKRANRLYTIPKSSELGKKYLNFL